jgi:hypothetical protein
MHCDEKKGWMKQAPLIAESCKRIKLLTIVCDEKPKIIFCGVYVHDFFFLACYEDDSYSLLMAPTMW